MVVAGWLCAAVNGGANGVGASLVSRSGAETTARWRAAAALQTPGDVVASGQVVQDTGPSSALPAEIPRGQNRGRTVNPGQDSVAGVRTA